MSQDRDTSMRAIKRIAERKKCKRKYILSVYRNQDLSFKFVDKKKREDYFKIALKAHQRNVG